MFKATKQNKAGANFRGRPRNPSIRASLRQWSAVVGMTHDTLSRKLTAAGVDLEVKPGPRAEDVFGTLLADPAQARAAKAREETELLAIKRKEKEGSLVELDLALDVIANAFLPVRQAFLALPGDAARRVNPADPDLARIELEAWVDRTLEKLRAGLPDEILGSAAWRQAIEAELPAPTGKRRSKRKRRRKA